MKSVCMKNNNLRLAFVYDWFDKWGGVERLLLKLHQFYPQADFYTSFYDQKTACWAKDFSLTTSFIQSFPGLIKKNRFLSLPFLPRAFESFQFSQRQYDLVVSLTSSFAKGIITPPKVCHICYLLTPTRFLWEDWKIYFPNLAGQLLFLPYLSYLRRWDYIASQRPDYYFAISKTAAERCLKYYQRKAEVIYPPFDLDYWQQIASCLKEVKLNFSSYYLAVARLEVYKRMDFLIDYFNHHPRQNLIIVGLGTQYTLLRKKANSNIQLLGQLSDHELGWLYQHANALIMPQKEDFGYTALEAQFFGCPVIAYAQGGAKETVINGQTGLFFEELTFLSLEKTIARLKKIAYNLKSNLLKERLVQLNNFSLVNFQNNFHNLLIKKYKEYESNNFCRGNRD